MVEEDAVLTLLREQIDVRLLRPAPTDLLVITYPAETRPDTLDRMQKRLADYLQSQRLRAIMVPNTVHIQCLSEKELTRLGLQRR